MTNNDIFRRLRYVFDFSDKQIVAIFALADSKVTHEQLHAWFKKEEADGYQTLNDTQLAVFLNGLINEKRGKKEGPQPEPEKRLNNNLIFRKLRIALNITDEGILEVLALAGLEMSKHELSAFFRKPGHKNYRECKDQVLRNFLKGLQNKHRPAKPSSNPSASPSSNPKPNPSPWDRAKRKKRD
ncbi:DUF1456 family protein [Pseudomonadota bacterium]